VSSAPKRINHVGLAVPNIQAFLDKTMPLYGELARGPMIVNERQQVRELCLTDGATTVELLEPLADGSPLRSFLRRNPSGGLLHLALDVVDLDASIARVTAAGGRLLVGPVPDVAFGERRIAFVYLGGQVTELVEQRSAAESGGD
jgi:methylmalonyl-CoA/ethylmalonyl-CoA epimerase